MCDFPWFLQKNVGIGLLNIRNYSLHRTKSTFDLTLNKNKQLTSIAK